MAAIYGSLIVFCSAQFIVQQYALLTLYIFLHKKALKWILFSSRLVDAHTKHYSVLGVAIAS